MALAGLLVGGLPETIRKEMSGMDTQFDREAVTRRPTGLGMPQQAPPVDRTAAITSAAYGDTPGIEASSFWDTLGDIGKVAGPVLMSLL